jgi:predicted amidohydrolase
MCGRRISESCEGGCADERGDGQVLPLLLGIPAEVLVPVGGFLVVYAASLWFLGTRARVSRPAVWVVVVGNLLWAGASVVAAAAGWWSPTATGIAVVLAQAAAVVVFAELQLTGLRRSRTVA